MSKKTKAFLYNFLSFVAIYIPALFIVKLIVNSESVIVSIFAFVISLVLGPKFQYVKTSEDEKIFMKWIFVKGIKEVK
ncbi:MULTISPECIES: hypothetical protein [Flavobacterium]|uniref:Uncharacterized protein n=1 Tax=Flavobacterium jumunjinense TaxID=998845 RepID=A0ABV5GHV2_9FLAO|nr:MULTISPECIES: hypothetical protein [Flavobacterium]